MGVAHLVGFHLDAPLEARIRKLRELERAAAETPRTPEQVLAAIRDLLLEAEAETDPSHRP
jgi:hypothetical protein